MPEFIQTTVDKFTFKVATDRLYNTEGIWVKEEDSKLRVGVSDFIQQRSGDIAFADVQPVGTELEPGDLLANIETIKVDMELASPISGSIVEVNPAMDDAPEAINQDPYGAGWILIIAPNNWEAERDELLDAERYFEQMKAEAEEEAKKL